MSRMFFAYNFRWGILSSDTFRDFSAGEVGKAGETVHSTPPDKDVKKMPNGKDSLDAYQE